MASPLPSEKLDQRSSPNIEARSPKPATITPTTSANFPIYNDHQQQPTTPRRARPQSLQSTPKSAPAQYRTHLQLTSPEAARRSKRSLEAIHVARALKDGFSRLKARADPQSLLSPSRSAKINRPFRTYSATMGSSRVSNLLVRHHSSIGSRQPTSCPHHHQMQQQQQGHLGTRQMASAPRFALSANVDDHMWRPRIQGSSCVGGRSGAVEQAAEAMLFMRSQSSSSLNNEHFDSVSPPPPSLSLSRVPITGSAEMDLPVTGSVVRNVDLAPQSEFDAYETEEEILLPPIKRQRPGTSAPSHSSTSASATSSAAHRMVLSPQKQQTALGQRRNLNPTI
ncbi:hypothetical protein IWW45_000126 [Coemansia sp. RSA 485]|nr:hypothetical protein IWW45_000126 [Coemansia sp. RSA 485]